jgi:uncharacterized phage protein (TIGR02218 family)
MTYNADEASTYNGKPIELYKFEGTFNNYYYTSHNEDVIYLGQRYTAKPIKRSRIKVTTPSAGSSDLNIDLPAKDPLVIAYGFGVAPPDLYLTLTRYHDPSDVVTYWQGNVTNCRVSGNMGTLITPNEITRAMSGEIPSFVYQTPCNNVLGDARCGVDLDALAHETYMVNYDQTTVTVQSDGGQADQYYRAGFLETPYEKRSIVSHVGNVITIAFPLTKRNYLMPVTLRPGCNLQYEGDCLSKFNNQTNFGGFPFIPNINPFVEGID